VRGCQRGITECEEGQGLEEEPLHSDRWCGVGLAWSCQCLGVFGHGIYLGRVVVHCICLEKIEGRAEKRPWP
jgi:hypothetical protein